MSKKSKKRTNATKRAANKNRNQRLKYIDDEDKELDELEKIIADSEKNVSDSEQETEEDYLSDDREEEDFFASLDKEDEDIKPFSRRTKRKSHSETGQKFVAFIKDNTKYAIWGTIVAVLFIALIIALAIDTGNKSENVTKKAETNKLIKNTNKEIEELVDTYFTSLVNCDVDKLSEIMDSVENVSAEALKKESEYIEEYKNIECYTKKGIQDNEYVVYVYYENKILNIDTLAPGAIILYVKKDEEKGKYRIHSGISDTKISNYISKLSENKDVKNFNKEVDDKFTKACEQDSNLKAFYDALIAATQQQAESDATPAPETTQQEETQPQETPAP